ncbi:Zinc finger protein [Abeliophyllum distichum]|uniref:Zinc finger protein n=1 Tax=Abeliophyllum distichum TaxID=126358 RepID=A0ABD1V7C5_9LAMI
MPTMWEGIYQMMQVVKVLQTKRRLFFCCSDDECTYFKWDNGLPSGRFVEGQSSGVGLDKSVAKEINEDLTSIFKMLANLSEKKDVEISLNLTIRKGQGKGHELDS